MGLEESELGLNLVIHKPNPQCGKTCLERSWQGSKSKKSKTFAKIITRSYLVNVIGKAPLHHSTAGVGNGLWRMLNVAWSCSVESRSNLHPQYGSQGRSRNLTWLSGETIQTWSWHPSGLAEKLLSPARECRCAHRQVISSIGKRTLETSTCDDALLGSFWVSASVVCWLSQIPIPHRGRYLYAWRTLWTWSLPSMFKRDV